MSNGHPAGNELRKALKLLTVATIAVYIALVGLGVLVWVNQRNNRQALCNLRSAHERSVRSTTALLNSDKPEDRALVELIGRKLIITDRDDEQRTVTSLSHLDC